MMDCRHNEMSGHHTSCCAKPEAKTGGSATEGRTSRHPGYEVSQRVRKRVEEFFGWAKQIGGLRKTKFRGLTRLRQGFLRVMAAYNLVRIRNLLPEAAW